MANPRSYQRSFAGGEVSIDMRSRFDDARVQHGCKKLRNMRTTPQGTARRRPGFEHVAEVKDSTKKVRLLPFAVSADTQVCVQLGDSYLRLHSNGATVAARERVNSQNVTFDTVTGVVTWVGDHLLQEDDPVQFTNNAGSQPTGIPVGDGTLATTYYAAVLSATTMKLRTAPGGTTINSYAAAGSNVVGHFFYQVGEFARRLGVTYRCITAHIASPPPAAQWESRGSDTAIDVPHPLVEARLFGLKRAQSLDVMTLTHELSPVQELRRYSANRWTVTAPSLSAVLGPPGIPSLTASPVESHAITSIAAGANATWTTPTDHHLQERAVIYVTGVGAGTVTQPNNNYWIINDASTPTTFKVKAAVGGALFDGGAGAVGGTLQETVFGSHEDNTYVVTSADDNGNESLPGPAATLKHNLFADGAYIDLTWTMLIEDPNVTRWNIYRKTAGVFAYIGSATTMSFRDDNIDPDLGRTIPLFSTEFNALGSYPAAVTYFEGRRCFGGSVKYPNRLWMTRSGTDHEMVHHLPVLASDRIVAQVAARERLAVRHLVPLGHLLALTSSAEVRITPLNTDSLTPDSVAARPQTAVGANDVHPAVINGALVFAAARGGHIHETGFLAQQESYIAHDLSLRATHLFDGLDIVDMAFQKAPYPTLWCVNSAGKLLSCTYEPAENVVAWHMHETDGTFESCAVVTEGTEDRLYVVVRRTILGVQKRFVERMALHLPPAGTKPYLLDGGGVYSGTPVSTISAPHLDGKTVGVLADGVVQTARVVTGGVLTLDRPASVVHYGIRYNSDLETLPPVLQVDGFGSGRQKNVSKAWLRIVDSPSFLIGPTEPLLVPSDDHTAAAGEDVVVSVHTLPEWTDDGTVLIRQSDPVPLTIVGLTLEVAVGGG